jgi:hypothetical protein
MYLCLSVYQARIFWGVAHPPPTPPEAFGTAPKSFCTPANYIYFDLMVSYLIILATKFVKLPILWSQISPCRPRKQILFPWPFRALPHRPGQSKQQHPPPPPQIVIHPTPERKYENPSLLSIHLFFCLPVCLSVSLSVYLPCLSLSSFNMLYLFYCFPFIRGCHDQVIVTDVK